MIFLGVYDDWIKATFTVKQLLAKTEEKIVVRFDGQKNPLSSEFPCEKRVFLVWGSERLKQRGYGGRNAHNYLNLYLSFSKDDTLIKIDPDTGVNRAPILPDSFDVASNVLDLGEDKYLQGGAMAFSSYAAHRIIDSKILLDDKYKGLDWCYRWQRKEWIPCEDKILYDVIQRLKLNLVDWNDVYATRYDSFNPPYPMESYSFYHPL